MRKAFTGIILLALLLLGSLVYFWGAGAFWPCEPAGRLINGGSCTHLATGNIGSAAKLPNGNLLLAMGAEEKDTTMAVRLVEIPATGGAPVNDVSLPPAEYDPFPSDLAVSPDGTQVAVVSDFQAGRKRSRLSVYDPQGNIIADDLTGGVFLIAFDARGRLLTHPGGILGEYLSPGLAQAFDLAVSTVPQLVNWDELGVLFQKGLTIAYSPDGTVFAQVMDHMDGTPFVGLRVGTVGLEDRPGWLLGASIRTGCNYSFSDLAFSPDGKRIAAVFDCPGDWGVVSSTMEVWDHEAQEHLLTVPVVNSFADPFWYDDSTIIVERVNYVRGGTDLFRVAVPEPRRR